MKNFSLALAGCIGLFAAVFADDEPKIDYKPLSIGALSEMGQLKRGIYKIGPSQVGEVWTNDWYDHFGAFVTKEAVVNDRLFLDGGLGGVFEFRKPERVDPGFYGSQRKGFFIGPTKAMADYHFGDPENPWLTLGTGMFMYKYNNEAYDLGEYLFRSLAYPSALYTGGYVIDNSAAANLQGVKSSLHLGNFKGDFLLTTQTTLAPLYDWSVSFIGSYTMGDGLLELGAGVNFKDLISVRPSRTSPLTQDNGYFEYNGQWYTSNENYYSNEVNYYQRQKTAADSAKAAPIAAQLALVDSLINLPSGGPAIKHYTSAGTILMGRATLDLKKVIGSDLFGPQDLKLYTEASVLGVKDYPVFYNDVFQRIPVMVGFNLPGFHFLDLVAVQVEMFHSPWLNNTEQIANGGYPLPHFPIAADSIASETNWNDLAKKDDLKWSVLIQKKLGNLVTFSMQAADDHLHSVSSRYFYGPQFDHNEVTVSSKDWYWIAQLSWGI